MPFVVHVSVGAQVLPGSHHTADAYSTQLGGQIADRTFFKLPPQDVPAVALETVPGDLALFDHRCKHAAFGGGSRRRMFTTNWYGPTATAEEHAAAQAINQSYYDLENPRGGSSRHLIGASAFKAGWWEAAPPERRPYIENHVRLWGELAAADAEAAEARGGADAGASAARPRL
jgi:ectoine hydroxylase-related dioxygenase (phytanoyl-CoA dioxygenase family)